MSIHVPCVLCRAAVAWHELSPRVVVLVHGHPWGSPSLHLLLQLKLSQCPHYTAPWPRAGLDEALSSRGMDQPDLL